MHPVSTRQTALDLLDAGLSRRDVCRMLGVGYNSTYRWQQRLQPRHRSDTIRCFRCDDIPPPDVEAYVYLLGQYLGDGHIRRNGRSHSLGICCCTDYVGVMAEVEWSLRATLGASVCYRSRADAACVTVESTSRHWLCLFPQHGPGMKHTRKIELAEWQRDLVATDPRPLIRGLIHSDGCRITNWTERRVGGTVKRYTYPRYFFSNVSDDIRGIFTDALDLLGIAWKQNRWNSISVARRDSVAALDDFVGPKY
ncbi:MAG: helix-turn-helix domain-containing protein [Frankiales bacterium]|nr:helix-turn-helix domain-containing protein [Frankiales bacterium]